MAEGKEMKDAAEFSEREYENIGKSLEKLLAKFSKTTRKAIANFDDALDAVIKETAGQLPQDVAAALAAQMKFSGAKIAGEAKKIQAKLVGEGYDEDTAKKIIEALQKEKDLLEDIGTEYRDVADAITDPITSFIDKIKKSKIGNILLNSMGIPSIEKEMKQKVLDTLLEGGKLTFANIAKAATVAMQYVGKMIKAVFAHPLIAALIAIGALLVLTWKRFQAIQKTLKTIRQDTGILGKESDRLLDITTATNLQFANMGVTLEIASKSVTALANQFQTSQRITQTLVEATSLMQTNLGASADEAAGFLNTMMSAGDLTDKQAANLAGLTANLALAGKVAPRKILADMAKSSGVINTYFRGNVTAAAKAAVELARMGTSLEKMEGTAEKLLNWDESITAEMEASVMMGRHLNLSQARFAAYTGDIEGMTKAITEQVGKAADFDRLTVLQKKAIASATGMSVDELAKMLKQQEEMNAMLPEEKRQLEAARAEMADLTKGAGYLQTIQKQIAQEKMSQAFDKLVTVISQILVPLLNFVVLPAFEAIAAAINFLTDNLKGALAVITAIGTATAIIFKDNIIAGIKGAITATWDWVKGLFASRNAAVAVNVAMGPINWIAIAIGAAVGAIAYWWEDIWGFIKKIGKWLEPIISGLSSVSSVVSTVTGILPFAEGGIVTKPTIGMVGEAGRPEAVIPLDRAGTAAVGGDNSEVVNKIQELIDLMKDGSTINLDGNKVGQALVKTMHHPVLAIPM